MFKTEFLAQCIALQLSSIWKHVDKLERAALEGNTGSKIFSLAWNYLNMNLLFTLELCPQM